MENVNEVINKGIPIDAQVALLGSDILKLAGNKKEIKESFDKEMYALIEFLEDKVDYYPDIQIFQTLGIVQDSDSINKLLCYSTESILTTLIHNLNMSDSRYGDFLNGSDLVDFLSDEELGCKKAISNLRKVVTDKKLAKNYPMLYQSYVGAFELKKSIQRLKSMLNGFTLSYGQKRKLRENLLEQVGDEKNLEKLLRQADEELNPKKYANACADLFTYMVDNFQKIMEFLHQHPIDLSSLTDEEVSKFELYVAHKYLQYAENVDLEYKQRYLYYVSNYFSELGNNVNGDLEIIVDEYKSDLAGISDREGYVVTPKSLQERYKQLLISYPELKTVTLNWVDFSTMSPSEVEEFMNNYLKDLSANWEMIPNGKSLDEAFTASVLKKTEGMSAEEKEKYREHLTDLYLEKKTFHESLDPFCTLQGLGTFDGYVAYVHSNGKIVLEKYFDNVNTGRVSTGDAIYIMDSSDFHRLSQLSKRELIESGQCKRVIHRGNWQSRVLEEIKTDGSKTSISNDYKELVKTGAITGFNTNE